MLSLLGRMRAPIGALLTSARLPREAVRNTEALVPVSGVARLLERSARTQVIGDLGLRCGRETRIEELGVFGQLVSAGPTLQAALEVGVQQAPAFASGERLWIVADGDGVRLCHAYGAELDEGYSQACHYSLMLMINAVRLAAGPSWCPATIELQCPESTAVRNANDLAAATISFNCPATAITVPRALLSRPVVSRGGARAGTDVVASWKASAPAPDFVGSLVQVVNVLSAEGFPDVGRTANVVGVSARTLQRRLELAGVTYTSLVDRARFAAAVRLLEETDAPVLAVALELGYSDHAHFTRAFRRWAGCSPRDFRRAKRQTAAVGSGRE